MYPSLDRELRAAERFKNFALWTSSIHLLPVEHTLVVDNAACGIIHVDWCERRFLARCCFSDEQFPLVLILLERWPSYVPYEGFLTLLDMQLAPQGIDDLERVRTSGSNDETEAEKALNQEAWHHVQSLLSPLQDLIESCRGTLHELGIDIGAVMNCGYLLVPLSSRQEAP